MDVRALDNCASVAGAALLNALELVGKDLGGVRVVFSGAGAAGFAMAKFLLALGVRREHLVLTDAQGVVYAGRGDGNFLEELVADTDARTLAEVAAGVAEAALQTGVAAVGLHLGAYREDLRHLAMSL